MREDPTFRVHTDSESGQTIISGMGELHLTIIVERLKREFGIEANVGKPQVAYREAIRKVVEQEGKFVRPGAAAGELTLVRLKLEPRRGQRCLPVCHRGCRRGVGHVRSGGRARCQRAGRERRHRGVSRGGREGHVAGRRFARDSEPSEVTFRAAGATAFREGARKARPVLLEPIMTVTVVTPDTYMGAVTGDLARRRGVVESFEDSPAGKVVRARVPLAEMFGYSTTVRSMSQGRATHTMQFSQYAEVPANVSQFVIRDRAA